MNNLTKLLLLSSSCAHQAKKNRRRQSALIRSNAPRVATNTVMPTTQTAPSLILSNEEQITLDLPSSNDKFANALYLADAVIGIPPKAGPFTLPPLEYDYNALEPYIDEETLRVHHDALHQAYVDNLNRVLANRPAFYNQTLEDLLLFSDRLPSEIQTQVINNAGGHYNHSLMWQLIGPANNSAPTGKFKEAIGSPDNLKAMLKAAGNSVFGSGYAWLALNPYGRLQIVTTSNQTTPIPLRMIPILPIDVWEHSYFLKHKNKRGDYIDDYFNVINWDRVSARYEAALSQLQ